MSRSKVKRVPKRGFYDSETIYRILDQSFMCHVGIVHEGRPVVMPTMYGRRGNQIYIHGATVSRLIKESQKGFDVCITVTDLKSLVLARSAFHHSANYESVVVFGTGKQIPEDDKLEALKIISDHILKGRWEESRLPNAKEMKATSVVAITIEEASAKIRTGPPIDDEVDYDLNIWAGELPLESTFGSPIPDSRLKPGIELPNSIKRLQDKSL